MEDKAQVLEGGRLGQHMLPNMPIARSCAIKDDKICLAGADGEAKGMGKAVHASQKGLESGGRIAAQHHQHTPERTIIYLGLAGPQHVVQRCLDGHASHQRSCQTGWG